MFLTAAFNVVRVRLSGGRWVKERCDLYLEDGHAHLSVKHGARRAVKIRIDFFLLIYLDRKEKSMYFILVILM